MALYRKYRPATFAEVVGQAHVTEPISTALTAGRINHAYLFSGPRGCGKTSSARILARSLNCVTGPTATPCGVCFSCVALAPGGPGNLDVIELDAASHGGVDDTRELRDRAFFTPAESRYRVFIVDEAHMVTNAGFNALLKIVEEPPEHLIFIFATTEPEKVLPTIRSRTHHYPFRLLPPSVMRGLLEKICAREQVTVEDAVYPLVIRSGGGSPRDSLSVLDQLLAGAGEEGVTYPRALALLGVTDVALIDDAVDALAANDGAALFETVHRVMEAGHDPRRFAADLLDRMRDLILMQAVPGAVANGLVDVPGDVLVRMREEAQHLGPATLARYAELLHGGLGEMRGATAPRLLLEVVCARMLLPAASDAESAVLQRLERVERRMSVGLPTDERHDESTLQDAGFQRPSQRREQPSSPQPSSTQASSPQASPARPATEPPAGAAAERVESRPIEREPEAIVTEPAEPVFEAVEVGAGPIATPGARQPDAAAIRTVWSEVRARVRERSRTTEVMLSGATVRGVDGDTLVLGHDSAPLAKRLTEPRNAEVVQDALRVVFGVEWKVICEVGAGPVAPKAAPAAPLKIPAPPTRREQVPLKSAEQLPARRSNPAEPNPAAPRPAPAAPRFSRPSQSAAGVAAGGRRDAGGGRDAGSVRDAGGGTVRGRGADIPPPDEPDYPDDPDGSDAYALGIAPAGATSGTIDSPEDEAEMLADAAAGSGDPQHRQDPEEMALKLLATELGARPIDGG